MAQVVESVEANGTGGTAGRAPGTKNVPVTWNLIPVSELPPKRTGAGGFPRNTVLDGILDQIKNDVANNGRPFEIGVYGDDERAGNSARTKASALRKKGYTEAEGWVFRVGDSQTTPGQTALFAQYG